MKEINAENFEKEVLKNGKVVVDFYSTECPPCEALAPKFESLADIYGEKIVFLKIFRQQNRELAEKYGVKSSPTLLFFNDGVQSDKVLTGGIKKSEIIQVLDTMLNPDEVKLVKSRLKPSVSEYDAVILGGGPAGLAAGLYLCQAKIKTALIDIQLPGGQVSTTHQVSNYPGFPEPQPGYMLAHFMSEQTKICGTKFKVAVDVGKIDLQSKTIVIDEYETIRAKKIIIATGASPKYLGINGEKEYKGRGISYCATCDAKYYQNKEVVIIGGGNTAVEEADFIAKYASKITLIHQFSELTANKSAQERILNNSKITVLFNSEPREFIKKNDKMIVKYENLNKAELFEIEVDGVFVFVGMKPNTELLPSGLKLDDWGYIQADEDMKTNIDGVYAIGDVRSKKYRQITTAVADGTIAAISISKETHY